MIVFDTLLHMLQEEMEETERPEINLLWAVYDRTLRDLELKDYGNPATIREAIAWFRDRDSDFPDRITFGCVIEHCHPSAKLMRLTAARVRETEEAVYQTKAAA